MNRYLVKRIINMFVILILATMISFVIMQMAPGGPENVFLNAENQDANVAAEKIEQLRERWGLNDPVHVQYYRWLRNAMTGDFGYSYFQRRPVFDIIFEALPNTLELNIITILLAYAIAIPLGVISAVRQYSKFDYAVTGIAFVGQAAPDFWIAMLLIWGVAMHSGGVIPTNGIATPGMNLSNTAWFTVLVDRLRFLLLPLTVDVFGSLTGLTRYMRSSMLEVLKEDYVRTARAKGLAEKIVVYKHALRNALLPIVSMSGGILSALVGGAVVLETIFSWPGIGRVAFDAVTARDYPVAMGTLVLSSVLLLIGYLLVDIAYVFVDPRIKYD